MTEAQGQRDGRCRQMRAKLSLFVAPTETFWHFDVIGYDLSVIYPNSVFLMPDRPIQGNFSFSFGDARNTERDAEFYRCVCNWWNLTLRFVRDLNDKPGVDLFADARISSTQMKYLVGSLPVMSCKFEAGVGTVG